MANLTIRVGSRYYPPVVARNGPIKPGWATINGRQIYHPGSVYYLDWTEGSKRRRKAVGRDATNAQNLAHAHRAAVPDESATLLDATASYLAEVQAGKKAKTLAAYSLSLGYFLKHCQKQSLQEVDRSDLLAYATALRDVERLAARICHNL